MAVEHPGLEESWTLQTLLHDFARFGNRPALIAVHGESLTTWSFAEIADHARRLATGLVRDGMAPGEPVLLMAPNSPEWVIVYLALGAAGALAVPLDHLSTPDEVETVLRDYGCRRAFVPVARVAMLREMHRGADVQIFVLDDGVDKEGLRSWRALLSDAAGALPPLTSGAPMMLVHTSGTTGAPKSFILSSTNIWANVRALVEEHLAGPQDRLLLPLPLHHIYPLVVGLLAPLASGVPVVFPEGLAGPQIVQALRASAATGIIGVPRLYAALVAGLGARVAAGGRLPAALFNGLLGLSIRLRRRFGWRVGRVLFRPLLARVGPELRLLVSGGAQLDESLVWQLEGLGWQVLNGYGLAETASMFTANLPGRERIGSEGRPLQGSHIRIGDPNEAGVGEIQLRGPNVFTGYRNNPEADRDAFTPDGWFRTGDLGHLDAEGYLFFKGRMKELIVLGGGKNVFPEAVEKAYGTSPFIHEIAVLEHAGALHALVLPNTEAFMAFGTTRIEDALRVALGSAGQRLPSHQRLAGYAIVRDPLPRTRLGKYRRFLLPELYERARSGAAAPTSAELSPEDRALLEQPLPAEVWRLLEDRYPGRPLSLEASPQLDLGIDSLEWITLGLELERRLGISLSEAEAAGVLTVRDLIAAVQTAAHRPPAVAARQAPDEALVAERMRWTRPRRFWHTLLALILFWINRLAMKSLFRLKAEGLGKLPPPGAFVIVANHASYLDALALAAVLPLRHMRRTFWGGDITLLFSRPWRRFLCRVVHIFPVDAQSPGTSLALASAVLTQGHGLVWFPEAWRTPTGELQRFYPGIGALIEQTGATAVPAYIAGTFEAMPRWARVPRLRPISVRFGDPLTAAELAAGQGESAAARITLALERAVTALSQRARA
jgi:long-chain acyl-CoA synthetase